MTDIWQHVLLLYSLLYPLSIGLLLSVHHSHVNLGKVTTKLRDHHSSDARDTGCRHDIMERGKLWGEVHLHREGPASGGRVPKQQQDTSWEILTQKPGPETLPRLRRGTRQSRPSLLPSFFKNQKQENDADRQPNQSPNISKWYVSMYCSCLWFV